MTSPKPTIRDLAPEDRDAVRELHEACFREDVAFDDLVLDRVFRHGHTFNLVAELDDRIVGYAAALHGSRPTARLLTIQTHPKLRGQGVAKRLLDEVQARLRARRAARLQLEVHVDNEAARNLYEERGFEVKRKDPTAYPSLERSTGYVMEKEL